MLVVGHDGPLVEKIVQRIGFRTFRIEDGIMKLNGKRVVFKGADRHEFDAKRGRAITRQDMIDDITFCKRHNINAIRTSHYPNQEYWYDLCDEYGIYLIDETNMETHGSWVANNIETPETAVPGSKPRWEGACVDRINSMMRRDYNHPSVLIWSLGNESFAGEVFRAMHAHAHAIDPNRPVHYEGSVHDRAFDDVTDIESRMYAHADEIEEYLKSNPKKPYISCEYMHAMGNSVGNMDEYTALERYPQYQGGFIWDFIDQAILDSNGRMCYGGDFGDRPSDYEFSGDGLLFADRTPSPKAQDVKQLYANVHMTVDASGITITNDNLFVSTADSTFVLRILADGKPVWSSSRRFDVAAGTSEHVEIDWPIDDYRAGAQELVLEASQQLTSACDWAPAGYELSFGQCVVAGGKIADTVTAASAASDGAITLGRWNIGARSAGREALFSLAQGGMVSYKLGEREFVLRKPLITTFRALTDNDRGAGHAFERAQWAVAGSMRVALIRRLSRSAKPQFPSLTRMSLRLRSARRSPFVTLPMCLATSICMLRIRVKRTAICRRFRRSALNGCCRSSIRICDSMASARRKRMPTASMRSWAFGIRTPSAIARRICCRRKPATMRTCVGLRLRTILVMACA